MVLDIKQDGARERSGAIRGGSDFGPEDGVEAGLPGREEELNCGVEVGISQSYRGKTQFGRPGDKGPYRQEGVVKAVVGPDVERGIRNHGGYTFV